MSALWFQNFRLGGKSWIISYFSIKIVTHCCISKLLFNLRTLYYFSTFWALNFHRDTRHIWQPRVILLAFEDWKLNFIPRLELYGTPRGESRINWQNKWRPMVHYLTRRVNGNPHFFANFASWFSIRVDSFTTSQRNTTPFIYFWIHGISKITRIHSSSCLMCICLHVLRNKI